MNCKVNCNPPKASYYVHSSYPEMDVTQKIDELEEAMFTEIVIMDDMHIEAIKDINFQGKRLDVAVMTVLSEEQMNMLYEYTQQGIITEVKLGVQCAYVEHPFGNAEIVSEHWNYPGPYGATALDSKPNGTFNMKRMKLLLPLADDVANQIYDKKPINDLEKILLVDAWFQENTQYIKGRESSLGDVIYVCDDMGDRDSAIEDVLNNHYGRCEDIACTLALILNNPKLNIGCRVVSSLNENHSWNVVTCDGVEYLMDVTRNITRNPNKVEGALKAKTYCSQFTLFGINTKPGMYTVPDEYHAPTMAFDNMDRTLIRNTLEDLHKRGVFQYEWDDHVVMASYIKVKDDN